MQSAGLQCIYYEWRKCFFTAFSVFWSSRIAQFTLQSRWGTDAASDQCFIHPGEYKCFFFSGKPYFSFKRQMAWCFCVICIGEEPLRWQSVCDELFKFAFHLIKVGSYQAH